MPFDPLAFLKPDKALSMEGLLSRDMFENFAADDEEAYQQHTCEDILDDAEDIDGIDVPYEPEGEWRLQMLADMIDDQPEHIAQWLNEGYLVVIAMAPEIYEIVLLDDDKNQTVGCRVRINDGLPLSRNALFRLAQLMEQKIAAWVQDQVTTNTNFVPDGRDQINMVLISDQWLLNHATWTFEVDSD